MFTTVITFICVLGFLVFIHELGHYLAARMVGVEVQEFSIGFPPKMISKKVGATEYMISWIPLGGYVKLKGQNIEDENPNEPDNYAAKTLLQRFWILIAGPLMNILGAFIFLALVFSLGSEELAYVQKAPIIGGVEKNSFAETGLNLEKGDRILEIHSQKVFSWKEVYQAIQGSTSQTDIPILIETKNQQIIQKNIPLSQLQTGIGWLPYFESIIGSVLPQSAADKAGLQVGDRFIKINQIHILQWWEISDALQASNGNDIPIQIERNGNIKSLSLSPEWNEQSKKWIAGISPKTSQITHSLQESVTGSLQTIVQLTIQTFSFFKRLFTGNVTKSEIGGPLMIAKLTGEAAQKGVVQLFQLIGLISFQLGILNLLPIPALDGGHIFFLFIEWLKRKPLSVNFRQKTQMIGFSLLIGLMIFVTVQDWLRL